MSDIRDLDLNLLPVLSVLLEERSVTRAARRLGLTQSAVSGTLARLREALGDPLFVRGRQGIVPTPRAEAMAAPLRAWLDQGQALVVQGEEDPLDWDGAVALAATDYTQHVLLTPFLRALHAQAPRLRVAVHPLLFDDVRAGLGSGVLDLAISASGFVPAEMPSLSLMRERYVLAMWKRHPLSRKKRVTLDDVCRHDHVVVSPSGGSFRGPVDEQLEARGRQRRVRLSVPSFSLMPGLLSGSDLLCITPRRMVEGHADIHVASPPLGALEVRMVASWHPRLSRDARHRWLRQLLLETARGL